MRATSNDLTHLILVDLETIYAEFKVIVVENILLGVIQASPLGIRFWIPDRSIISRGEEIGLQYRCRNESLLTKLVDQETDARMECG